MANTIQSVGRSFFNLISRVLISPIYTLEAIWLTILTLYPPRTDPTSQRFLIPGRSENPVVPPLCSDTMLHAASHTCNSCLDFSTFSMSHNVLFTFSTSMIILTPPLTIYLYFSSLFLILYSLFPSFPPLCLPSLLVNSTGQVSEEVFAIFVSPV